MAGGNYGGSSIPTTPILGSLLLSGQNTAYKNWLCTSVVATAAGDTFLYSGNTITVGLQPLEFIINPQLLGTGTDAGQTFFCYSCDCSAVMSGSTAPWSGMTNPSGPLWNPVIIGGNGLNS